MNVFSERLRYERKQQGLSQRQMAEKLGITQGTYKGYELVGSENGREPSMEMICRIADLLQVSIDYLFGRID